jgi:hypothetical protein
METQGAGMEAQSGRVTAREVTSTTIEMATLIVSTLPLSHHPHG